MNGALVRPLARWSCAWWLFALGGGALVTVYHWIPAGLPRSLTYNLVGLLGLAAITLGISINRPVRRRPWYLLLASQALWVLADAITTVLAARGDDGFPTVADIFYLSAYPVLALSLVLLTRGRRPSRDVVGVLDAMTVLIGMLALLTIVFNHPLQRAQTSTLALAVSWAYPQLDIVIFVILAALITTPGVRTVSLQLLVVALGLIVVADVAATALDALSVNTTGPLDHLWLASYVLLGSAVLHPSLHELSIPRPAEPGQFSRWRFTATMLVTLVPSVVLVGEHLLGVPISVWAIALSSAVLFALVVSRMYLVIREIAAVQTERERAQAALAYQASHDSLTGLPNRAQGMDLIVGSMARAQRSGAMIGLLFVDLDGFKAVNDTYGHQAGDEVLHEVADRMRSVVREGDMVGRLGGDEFVVLLEPVVETESAMAVGERLIAEVSAPIELSDGQGVRVGASVGVAIGQDASTDAEALLNEADTAAYRAKRLGRGRVEVFGESLRRELQERADLEQGLRLTSGEDALILEFEPVLDITRGNEVGYDVHVSWDRPGGGRLASGDFRPVAALSDLVFELDTWVMRRAVQQLAVWNSLDAGAVRVAVDLTARHVARARVLEDVRAAVADAGIDPAQLLLKVTDTTLIDRVVGYAQLGEIRASGVQVLLGDFGIGYSSVKRLQQLPIDAVELDGGFADWHTPSGAVLLRLTVEGVLNFGLPLAVCGVVDGEHFALLRGMGCEVMRGPYFDGPFSGDEVAERLRAQTLALS